MAFLQIILLCCNLALTQQSTPADVTPPEFIGPCFASVFETVQVGTLVTQCVVVDFSEETNTTTNNSLTYQITSGNIGEAFGLSEVGLGNIETRRELDREEVNFYRLTVTATDAAGLNTSTQINITIMDVNDNAPMFISPPMEILLTTESILGYETVITTLEATDADTGRGGEFNFTLVQVSRLPGDTATDLQILVTDFGQVQSGHGVAQLSSNHTLRVLFESACLEQDYTIDPFTGVLSGRFLCRVEVMPAEVNLTIGETQTLACLIEKNIDGVYIWFHNGIVITSFVPYLQSTSSALLHIVIASDSDGGEFVCSSRTSIGRLDSPPALVRVIPGIIWLVFCTEYTSSSTVDIHCINFIILTGCRVKHIRIKDL